MTRLQSSDPPEIYLLTDVIRVRLRVDGDADDRWRRIYNELASAQGIPAEAFGTEGRSTVLVTFPADFRRLEVSSILDRTVGLATEVDNERRVEEDALSPIAWEVREWFRLRRHLLI
jgi:hypothetical protein